MSLKVTSKDNLFPFRQTARVCSESGCDKPGRNVGGHYNVESRRVRVWVCDNHFVGNPNREVPVPASIQFALKREEAFLAQTRERMRYVPVTGRSIKTLAPSGHGEPIPGDRVAQWRWGA